MTVSPSDMLTPFDRATLERAVCGALKDTINAHGPITHATASSAAKRVISLVKAMRRQHARREAQAMQPTNGAVDPRHAEVMAFFEELAQAHAA